MPQCERFIRSQAARDVAKVHSACENDIRMSLSSSKLEQERCGVLVFRGLSTT
jgi:hypothetical protein